MGSRRTITKKTANKRIMSNRLARNETTYRAGQGVSKASQTMKLTTFGRRMEANMTKIPSPPSQNVNVLGAGILHAAGVSMELDPDKKKASYSIVKHSSNRKALRNKMILDQALYTRIPRKVYLASNVIKNTNDPFFRKDDSQAAPILRKKMKKRESRAIPSVGPLAYNMVNVYQESNKKMRVRAFQGIEAGR